MGPLTTHVLNTASGRPASDMRISIDRNMSADDSSFDWQNIGETMTNSDGRGPGILSPAEEAAFAEGVYKMTFFTKEYFDRTGEATFYPYVEVVFRITDVTQHYHIPLLISPYGYSTYRGS